MSRGSEELLAEIERKAVDSRVLLSEALRSCVILAGKMGSAELRTWASRELSGYAPEDHDELPSWRRVRAPLQIDGVQGRTVIRGQTIGRHFLPDFTREDITEEVVVFWGVGELEAMIRNADDNVIRLGPYMASELAAYMNAKSAVPFQHIERLYWSVGVSTIDGVLDRVRTALIERIAELRDLADGRETHPTIGDEGAQAGYGHTLSAAITVTAERPVESLAQRRWDLVAVWLGTAAGVAGAVFALLQLLQ